MKKTFIISLALAGSLATSCDFLNVDDYFEDTFSEEGNETSRMPL